MAFDSDIANTTAAVAAACTSADRRRVLTKKPKPTRTSDSMPS